jgi:hypothetical protein
MYHQRSISLPVSVPAIGEELNQIKFELQADKLATVMAVLIVKGKKEN